MMGDLLREKESVGAMQGCYTAGGRLSSDGSGGMHTG